MRIDNNRRIGSAVYLLERLREVRSIVQEEWLSQTFIYLERIPIRTPADIAVIVFARDLLKSLEGAKLTVPQIWRDPKGTLHIEWMQDKRSLELEISRPGEFRSIETRPTGQTLLHISKGHIGCLRDLVGRLFPTNTASKGEILALLEVSKP